MKATQYNQEFERYRKATDRLLAMYNRLLPTCGEGRGKEACVAYAKLVLRANIDMTQGLAEDLIRLCEPNGYKVHTSFTHFIERCADA